MNTSQISERLPWLLAYHAPLSRDIGVKKGDRYGYQAPTAARCRDGACEYSVSVK